MQLPKVDTPTRAQWVYDRLKEAILSGAVEPGERLVVDQLARELGTSPIPIREAIRRLEAEELVETTPYIGARVAPVRPDLLEELMAIRTELEPLLAKTAVKGVTDEALQQLEQLLHQMKAVQNDPVQYSRLNYDFHRTMYSLSPWTVAQRLVNTVWDLSARTRFIFVQQPASVRHSHAEHEAMLEALREKDGAKLEKLVRTQKERAFQLVRQTISPK